MKRLPTTMDKLQTIAQKLEQDALALRKRREQLARQQQRLLKQAHDEALRLAGAVVEKLGIALDDLGYLETVLKCGLERDLQGEEFTESVVQSEPHQLTGNCPMSNTSKDAAASFETEQT
jgi:hypothetical protein